MYSPEEKQQIVDHVCEQISSGRALTRILQEDEGLCSIAVFIRWQRIDEELRSQVERAREDGAQTILDEILEIADNDNADVYIETKDDGTKVAKIDGEAIQRSKLRVYAREKYAQMIAPRRFGQKLDLTSGGDKLPAPQPVLVDNRVQSLLSIALERNASKQELLDD